MTEKWGEIQGKLDLVRVSGEFELSGFYSKLKYFLYFFSAATWFDLFETESGILEVSFLNVIFFIQLCFVCGTNGLKVSHLSVGSLKNSEHFLQIRDLIEIGDFDRRFHYFRVLA